MLVCAVHRRQVFIADQSYVHLCLQKVYIAIKTNEFTAVIVLHFDIDSSGDC